MTTRRIKAFSGKVEAGLVERDQQKWKPVLRPIALKNSRMAHDLIAKPPTLWRIMRKVLQIITCAHRDARCDASMRPADSHRLGG
jgi:hypothetical protein